MLLASAPGLFLRICTPSDRELGIAGERIAARSLRRRGWRILARRWKTPHGEIDLACLEDGVLVAVEVKSARRGPGRWRPGARLDRRGVERLRRAARHAGRHVGAVSWRVDLIEVHAPAPGRRLRTVHHYDVRSPVTNP